ncbi:MAG: hypothetical protein U0Y10_23700 [Spirosomataceae bacterium]
MKKSLFVLALMCVSLVAFCQSSTNWKELDDYKQLITKMAAAADRNDFQPARDNAADLLAKAKVLMNATPPNATMSVAIKALTRRLYAESAGVNAAVGMKKPEPDLKNTIVKANNTYLEIVKKL